MAIKINMREIANMLSSEEGDTYVNDAGTELMLFNKEDNVLICIFGEDFNKLTEKELAQVAAKHIFKVIGLDEDSLRRDRERKTE